MQYPPPHYILFEPLNDINTTDLWNGYKITHATNCDFTEIDATEMNSIDNFAPFFDIWITSIKNVKYKVLLIKHADFLTYSCQQIIRRSLEQRSFKNRIWFHVEDPTQIQPAIFSRCVVKRISNYYHIPIIDDGTS